MTQCGADFDPAPDDHLERQRDLAERGQSLTPDSQSRDKNLKPPVGGSKNVTVQGNE